MSKSLAFYTGLLLLFLAGTGLVLKAGEKLTAPQTASSLRSSAASTTESSMPLPPLFQFAVQLLAIIIAAKVTGLLFQKIGQPRVMGEITAGILLGPSLLGWLAPGASHFLFPHGGVEALKIFSKMGILFFMFLTGMELDTEVLKKKKQETLMISHAGILFPFFLGMLISLLLFPVYGVGEHSFRAFALFMGVAMSITAFPVLVRILEERGMIKTPLGIMAVACAAVDDVTAWCLLAGVVGIVSAQSPDLFFKMIGWIVLYGAGMMFIARPLVRKITEKCPFWVNFFILTAVMAVSARITEAIGIHALFGAFAAGVIAPNREDLQEFFRKKISIVTAVLLPLFFALTGLRTEIGLLNTAHAWMACLLIVAAAVAGKFGGSVFAARFLSIPWKEALCLGALMNTRGLMELVVLNVGYDLGILSPSLFAMMIIMALATTFMTGPLLTAFQSSKT